MKELKNTRKAIIHKRFRRKESGWFNVPWLNLNGVWLNNAGFNSGDAIEIIVKQKELIIRNITKSRKIENKSM